MAETIPITRLTIKDAETGTETPVDVKTCARAVFCDENKTVQDHVAALSVHLANETNPHGVTAAQVGADPSGSAAAVQENLTDHENDKENPHKVTKAQVGLGNVDNTKDLDKPVSTAQQAAIDAAGNNFLASLNAHIANTSNPHKVTAAQVGAIAEGQVGNLHVWRRKKQVPPTPAGYTLGSTMQNVQLADCYFDEAETGAFYYYSGSSVTVADNGTVATPSKAARIIIESGTIVTGPIFVKGVDSVIPSVDSTGAYSAVYVNSYGSKVFYLPSDGKLYVQTDKESQTYLVVATKYQAVTGYAATSGTTITDYLTSADENAYTEGTVGDTTIEYLGQLGGGAKIEVGSYVGTGTYGSSNPNVLTFGFEPKLVVITVDGSQRANLGVFVRDAGKLNAYWYGANGYVVTLAWDKKGVSWHSTNNALNQLNSEGTKYPYIAIG